MDVYDCVEVFLLNLGELSSNDGIELFEIHPFCFILYWKADICGLHYYLSLFYDKT